MWYSTTTTAVENARGSQKLKDLGAKNKKKLKKNRDSRLQTRRTPPKEKDIFSSGESSEGAVKKAPRKEKKEQRISSIGAWGEKKFKMRTKQLEKNTFESSGVGGNSNYTQIKEAPLNRQSLTEESAEEGLLNARVPH